jgi:hypothetical protein
MATSKKPLYIGITVITLAVVATVIVYYMLIIKPKRDAERNSGFEPDSSPSDAPSTDGNTSGGSTPSGTSITNDTVFSLKNPYMKNERVQWIQYKYNQYAKARKNAGLTPDWPTIKDDSVYGPKTRDAVNRVMGKTSASWNEVKTRVDYLLTQLPKKSTTNTSSLNFNNLFLQTA